MSLKLLGALALVAVARAAQEESEDVSSLVQRSAVTSAVVDHLDMATEKPQTVAGLIASLRLQMDMLEDKAYPWRDQSRMWFRHLKKLNKGLKSSFTLQQRTEISKLNGQIGLISAKAKAHGETSAEAQERRQHIAAMERQIVELEGAVEATKQNVGAFEQEAMKAGVNSFRLMSGMAKPQAMTATDMAEMQEYRDSYFGAKQLQDKWALNVGVEEQFREQQRLYNMKVYREKLETEQDEERNKIVSWYSKLGDQEPLHD